MDKTRVALATAVLVCAFLAGCSQETVDARQIDTNDGLVYKHGSTEPFTGNVVYKDTIPTALQTYWSTNTAGVPGRPTVYPNLAGCQEHFAKGLADSDASCMGVGGEPALSVRYVDEQFDGPSKLYNLESGALIREQTWSSGKLDGEVKQYTYDGKQVVAEFAFKEGRLNGVGKQWTSQGDQLTDAVFKDGDVYAGTIGTDDGSIKTLTVYRDGKPNGPFVKLLENGQPLQKGDFVNGLREGPWEDQSIGIEDTFRQISNACSQAKVSLSDISNPTHVNSHWMQGKIDGEAQAWDEHGKVIFDLHFSHGALDGPNQVVAYAKEPMQRFTVSPGQSAAVQQAAAPVNALPTAQPTSDDQVKAALSGGVTLSSQQIVDAGGVNGLSVISKNADGYPIFQMKCEADGRCVGPTGEAIGDINKVTGEMPPVKAEDVARLKYICLQLCKDAEGNIVGSAP